MYQDEQGIRSHILFRLVFMIDKDPCFSLAVFHSLASEFLITIVPRYRLLAVRRYEQMTWV